MSPRRSPFALTALTLLGAALLAPEAAAYPLPPQTLWSLTDEADLVVLAEVQPLPDTAQPFDDVVVTLTVEKAYKGNAASTVSVVVERGVVCPAPARYEAGERVVAFLSRNTEAPAAAPYVTAMRSWGVVRFASTVELTAIGERIAEAVQHQQLDDPGHNRVRWALRAAAEPATAWHGAKELQSALRPGPWSTVVPMRLGRQEHAQLRQAFLAQEELVPSSALLLELLAADDDEAITEHAHRLALAAAQQELRAPRRFTPWWLMDGVVAAAARDDRRAAERFETWTRTAFDPMSDDAGPQVAFLSSEARRLQRRVKAEREPTKRQGR